MEQRQQRDEMKVPTDLCGRSGRKVPPLKGILINSSNGDFIGEHGFLCWPTQGVLFGNLFWGQPFEGKIEALCDAIW